MPRPVPGYAKMALCLLRLLGGTAAELDGNVFCFILGNYYPCTHRDTHTLSHTDIHAEATFKPTAPGGVSATLLKAPDSVSDTLSRWQAIAFSENHSNRCRLETGKF